MLCECCQQHEATIHLTQVTGGKSRELHLCGECAEQSGLNVQSVMSMPEVLFGMGGQTDLEKAKERSCPHCHLRTADFRKTARFGCPRCYETFADDIGPMLSAMHKGPRHVGKVPTRAGQEVDDRGRIDDLRKRIEAAVQSENYEEAARLRDLMRESDHDAE